MRIAFVVQRYGLEINGGAEAHCRQVAERLPHDMEVEVLTTCAQDYTTWENVYPPGKCDVNGILVHRFPTIQSREMKFGERSARLYGKVHTLQDEMNWLYAQGPVAPELLDFIIHHRFDYDVFIFFTYIYYPTALGLRLVADRALLVPTAHNEPPLYLDIFKALFQSPRAILYNTTEEKQLLEEVFQIEYIPGEVVGLGIDMPTNVDPNAFRRKYNIQTPYVVYVGRVSKSKNCHILLESFIQYKKLHPGSLKLILMGKEEISIPDHPDVISLGFVSEQDKFNGIAGAKLFLLPSKFESLSMVFLESLAVGTPVLTEGYSEVLQGHCHRSNAGLYYLDFSEFEAMLTFLLDHPQQLAVMAQNGMEYVKQNYSWEQVISKYQHYCSMIAHTPWW